MIESFIRFFGAQVPVMRLSFCLFHAGLFFVACGGDTHAPASDAGVEDASTSGSGSADAAADSSTAGSSGCAIQECFRPVRCVRACGESPVSVSCCPCAAPTFDDIECMDADSGGAGGSGGGGDAGGGSGGAGAPCGVAGEACPSGQACHCGGPGEPVCACGDICTTDTDCAAEQVCCSGVCTSPCGCYCL